MSPDLDAAPPLTFTGERFTPEVRGAIWYEHWHRYCAVAPVVSGLRVLDAACGEGYGAFLLSRGAAHVIGVDIGEQAIAHARERYVMPNLRFACASVTRLPLANASVDAIVSFETIEHLAAQRDMLAEFRRVLAPDGVLVVSSPNRPVYNPKGTVPNPFHVRELDRAELETLLRPGFPSQRWYAQRVIAGSVLWSERAREGTIRYDRLFDDTAQRADAPADPMYFVVVCAAEGVTLPALPAMSLFDDGRLSLWNDYARASLRERQLAWDELDARNVAEDRLAELVRSVNALASERERSAALAQQRAAYEVEAARLESDLTQARQELGARTQALEALRSDHDATVHALERSRAELARERVEHAETRARLAFRETPAGWVRWPLSVARRRMSGGLG